MKAWHLILLPLFALGGCVTPSAPFADPVEGDSFEFCPQNVETRAREFLHLGDRLTITEAEFLHWGQENGYQVRDESDEWPSFCGQYVGGEIRTVYNVTHLPFGRFDTNRRYETYYVFVDVEGNVRYIEEVYYIISS